MRAQIYSMDRFQKRLQAITKRATDFLKNFSAQEPIYDLLNKFITFSEEYVDLLKQVPPEISRFPYVVNRGIERLLQEWNILSRASEQRLIGGFTKELDDASELAQDYCNRWNKNLENKPYQNLKTPVVYFEKIFRISRSIYAPDIPVISIPLTDYDQNNNWQALAHEFSHHIFWNGFSVDEIRVAHQMLRDSVALKLSSSNIIPKSIQKGRYSLPEAARIALWENWLEEVFADVFGTLLAGPAYAVSSQDLMAEKINRIKDFTIADHDHPCIYLRPWISLHVLDEITNQMPGYTEVIDNLKIRWSEFSQQARALKYKDFSLASLEQDIQPIVRTILDGKYWPIEIKQQNMVKLSSQDWIIDPANLIPVMDDDLQAIAWPSIDEIDLPETFVGIKQHLKENSRVIAQESESNQPDRDANLLAWSSLLSLELSQSEGYHVHGCTSDHYHWWSILWPGHEHGELGTELRYCVPQE